MGRNPKASRFKIVRRGRDEIYIRGTVYDGVLDAIQNGSAPEGAEDPFPLLISSIRPTTRSFFTTRRATRESEKHKKEEGDDTAPFRSLSLCATTRRGASDHDDGEGGKTFRFVTTALSLSLSLALSLVLLK